jgi:CheY-like chemotaxis protein
MADICNRCSVLVVDDDRDTADSLVELLGFIGYSTRPAYTGSEALRLAMENPPDVVILDLLMPEMDGWELARRLQLVPTTQRPLLLAFTGSHEKAHRIRSAEAGIDLHLLKPVPLETIKDILERYWKEGSSTEVSACKK